MTEHRTVEFFDAEGHLLHNAIMSRWELGDYLFHNREVPHMSVEVSMEVSEAEVAEMTPEERGVKRDS